MIVSAARRAFAFAVERVNAIFILSLAAFFMQIPSYYGEDIVNARNNYLTGSRIDFWGGISTLVYAHVPNLGFRWQIWLAVFQITLTSIALQRLLPKVIQHRRKKVIKYLIAYSALTFGSQMTRDGLMFSLLMFGFATLNTLMSNDRPKKLMIGPLAIVCLAMSFRPWLSIAVVPLLMIFLKRSDIRLKRWVMAMLVITISIAPLAIELVAAKSLHLEKSFPQQQVMLMDTAASYCYTTNTRTGERAEKALAIFSKDPNYKRIACQLFRPDTWISLTKATNTSSAGFEVNISLIEPGNLNKYEDLESKWVELIINDPVTYIQNKILFASKLLIGSDSRNISIFSAETIPTKVLAIYRLLFDIAITFHLFSFIACIAILFYLPTKRYIKNKNRGLRIDEFTLCLITSIFVWNSLSAVAYVGSNGRYTYALSLLSIVIYFSNITQQQAKIDENR